MSSVEFDALLVSTGPDYPVRIVAWKLEGKTESEWYDHYYEKENDLFPFREYELKEGVDPKEADRVLNTCNWIDTYLNDAINNDSDQSNWTEDDRFDAGVFACRIRITGETDYWGEYDESEEFIEITPVHDLLNWTEILHKADR